MEKLTNKEKIMVKAIGYREPFADFLDRMIHGEIEPISWRKFVVTHYHDEFLEDIRRRVVRLRIQHAVWEGWTDTDREVLRSFVVALRNSVTR